MIFKTFDSDIDKISAKLGIFGRSFNQIGTAINNKITSIKENLDVSNDLSGSIKNSGDSIFRRLYPSKESIQSQMIDIDKLYPDKTDEQFSTILNDLQQQQKLITQTKGNWSDYFKNFQEGEKWQIDFVQNTDLQKASLDNVKNGYKNARQAAIAQNNALKQQTLGAKATALALKALSIAGNMLAMWAISEAITGLYKLSQASKDVAASASEMGSSFSSTKSDIEDYKQEVEELYETINDSSSSISEVTEARKQLMNVQDELIEKYGTEQSSIDAITKAIKGETSAWEKLTDAKWQETLNQFNDAGFWNGIANGLSGYDDNIERMKKEFGDYSVTLTSGSVHGLENREDLKNILGDFEGFNDAGLGTWELELTGNATEVYDQILKIQNLLDEMGVDAGNVFDSTLRELANDAKEVSDQYKDFFNEYVFKEEILKDTEHGYKNSYGDVAGKYDLLQEAIETNDTAKVTSATEEVVQAIGSAMSNALSQGNKDVYDAFRSMYPELQDEVDSWVFQYHFEANTDSLEDGTKEALSAFDGWSKEELIDFNAKTATEEQQEAWASLEAVAAKYHLQIEELIDELEKLGLVSSDSYQNLVKLFGQDAIDKLTPEELEIAYTISTEETEKALRDQRIKYRRIQSELKANGTQEIIDNYRTAISSNDLEAAEYYLERLEEKAEETGTTIDEIWENEELVDHYGNIGEKALSKIFEKKEALANISSGNISDIFSLENASDSLTNLGKISESIDKVQEAYKTLSSAISEYNTNGSISVDTLQTVIGLGDNWLDYLVDEEGNLKLDKEALNELTASRLADMKMQTLNNLMDNVSNIGDDIKATEYLTSTNYSLATSYEAVTKASLESTRAKLEDAVAAGTLSRANMNAVVTKAENDVQKINKLFNMTNFDLSSKVNTSSSSSSSDQIKDAFEKEYNLLKHNLEMEYITEEQYYNGVQALNEKYFAGKKEYLDEYRQYEEEVYKGLKSYYKTYCDDMMDYWESSLDANKITYKEYCDRVRSMLQSMYESGKITAMDYHNYVKTMLEKEKDIYDKILSAVTTRIDKEIKSWQKKIESVEKENEKLNEQQETYNKALSYAQYLLDKEVERYDDLIEKIDESTEKLNKQKDDYDGILSAIDKVYEDRIEDLNKQSDAIQEQIDLINDENSALDFQYRKEQALYALEKAKQQRTKKLYTDDKGYHYVQDTDAIRDAEKDLQDIQREEVINNLEKEKEALADTIEELEKYRDLWSEISTAYETETNKQLAIALYGQEYEQVILQNRVTDIETFKNNYLSIQEQLNDNETLRESYEEKKEYYNELKDRWSELSDAVEIEEQKQAAIQVWGAEYSKIIFEGRIEDLTAFKDNYIALQEKINSNEELIKSYEEKVTYYENLKEKWSEVSSAYEEYVNDRYAAQMWGDDWDEAILNGQLDRFEAFKNDYVQLQKQINEETWNYANEQKRALQEAENAQNALNELVNNDASGGTGVSGGNGGGGSEYVSSGTGGLAVGRTNLSPTEKFQKYGTGTTNAKKGLALVGEVQGEDELLVDNHGNAAVVSEPTLFNMEGGEQVYPLGDPRNLIDPEWLRNPVNLIPLPFDGVECEVDRSRIMQDMLSCIPNFGVFTPDFQKNDRNISTVQKTETNNITIGDIHLHEVQNVKDFARELDKYLPSISLQNGRKR